MIKYSITPFNFFFFFFRNMIKRDALDMKNIIALISKIVSGNLLEFKATSENLKNFIK